MIEAADFDKFKADAIVKVRLATGQLVTPYTIGLEQGYVVVDLARPFNKRGKPSIKIKEEGDSDSSKKTQDNNKRKKI